MIRKNWILVTVAGLGLTFSLPTFAQNRDNDNREQVRLNDIPDDARKAIRDEANGKEIKDVYAIRRGNETFYRARIDDKGSDRWVQVGRDGRVQRESDKDDQNNRGDNRNDRGDNRNGNLPEGWKNIRMNDMPEAVQRTIKREANGREIKQLNSITRNGETWYQARYDDRGGDRWVSVGRDGRVQNVTDADWERNNRNDREPVKASDRGRRDRKSSFEGWKRDKVDPDRLPGEVKRALGENDVKLDRLSEAWVNERNGRTVYHVIEKGPTRSTEYVVDANGKFLGEDNATPEGRDRVEFDRLPGPVKAALQRYGKPNDFRRIVAVTDRNRTWYEARREDGDIVRVGSEGDLVDREGDELRR